MIPLPDQKTIDDIILRITVKEKHQALILIKREETGNRLKMSKVVLDAIDAKLLRLKSAPNMECELAILGMSQSHSESGFEDDISRKA